MYTYNDNGDLVTTEFLHSQYVRDTTNVIKLLASRAYVVFSLSQNVIHLPNGIQDFLPILPGDKNIFNIPRANFSEKADETAK